MELTNLDLRLDYLPESPLSTEEETYLRYLTHLLNSAPGALLKRNRQFAEEGDGPDLLIYWAPEVPRWQRWLGYAPAYGATADAAASVLVVRQPRWPLRRVLLIMRANEADAPAMPWLEGLVRPSQAELFVLPIVPPVPAMYRHGTVPLQADVLLAPNTFSGAWIRRLAALCTEWGIKGTVLLHDSSPQRRIEWAIKKSDCDMVIISAEPNHWLLRRLWGELVRPLFCGCDRPLLIAKDAPYSA